MADEIGTGGSSGGPSDEAILGRLHALLDLAADRHIEEDPSRIVYTEPMQPYEELLGAAGPWGITTNDPAALRRHLLENAYAVEYANDTVVVDMPDGREVVYYLHGGKAWRGERTRFENAVPLFERVVSYDAARFKAPIARMTALREDLRPVPGFEDQVDAFIAGSASPDTLKAAVSALNPAWGDQPRLVDEDLVDWHGDAARAFKGACLYRLPSILTGQTVVAKVLEDALVIVSNSYAGMRGQAARTLEDAIDVVALYPSMVGPATPANWALVLNIVSGVAATITADSAVVGQLTVASAAAIVSGTAAVASAIIGAPANPEVAKPPPSVEGGTVIEIMANFEAVIKKYLDAVDNTERTLARVLGDFDAYVMERGPDVAIVGQTTSGDIGLSRHEAFFKVRSPEITLIAGSSAGVLDDETNMGPAPEHGKAFSLNLEALLKSGHHRLPSLGDVYFGLAGRGADGGLDSAFSRTSFGYVPGQGGDYTATTTGVLYPAWASLYDTLTSKLLRGSGDALVAAGEALVLIAKAFAEADAAAAAHLSTFTQYPGDMP